MTLAELLDVISQESVISVSDEDGHVDYEGKVERFYSACDMSVADMTVQNVFPSISARDPEKAIIVIEV